MVMIFRNESGRTIRILTPQELEVESFVRARRRLRDYGKKPDGSYICLKCGGFIKGALLRHPIFGDDASMILKGTPIEDRTFIAGTVYYYPNCEQTPDPDGAPVMVRRVCFRPLPN